MLILASASLRRRELLAQAGYSFDVQAASVPEDRLPDEDAISMTTRLAREKAQAVFPSVLASLLAARQSQRIDPESSPDPLLVLGADTMVVCDQELFGKPLDAQDAERMLGLLSGRTHQVVTGLALVVADVASADASGSSALVQVASELTHVTMQTLSAREISRYVATGEPMDKAGGYAIQGYAGRWIRRIGGCYFNVVGLPLALVSALLEGAQQQLAGRGTAH